MESVVILEKPVARVPLADWYGKVWELRQTCDTRRQDAFNLRSEIRQLRNDADSRTSWDTYHINNKLANRLDVMDNWKDMFTSIIEAIDKELANLTHEKALTESEIEFLCLNFTLVNECLTQRDQRGGADLCTDTAELEIKHELRILESLKGMLTKECQKAWDQINELNQMKFRMVQDIEDKSRSIDIDNNNLEMDRYGSNITYKMDCLRMPPNMISYEAWMDHCKFMKDKADSILEASKKTREAMFFPRERIRNDLKAQNDATNYALRKRIYEIQRFKNEMEWQRLNMAKDMEKLHTEICNLEKTLEHKTNALKLAETRNENRLYRPGKECCRDEVTVGLNEEILQLRKTQSLLTDKINQAKASFNGLEQQLAVVDRELYNKNAALTTDIRCLDLRLKLMTSRDRIPPPTQTDRNFELVQLKEELPPEN